MLALASLGGAARNWVSLWQGFDQLTMSVDSVEFDEDERHLVVAMTLVNGSDQRLRVHVLDTGLRLEGRSITGGSERYGQLVLGPGDEVQLETTQRVPTQDVDEVSERTSSGDSIWNVSGRVQISVEDLSDPLWLPFRYEVAAE